VWRTKRTCEVHSQTQPWGNSNNGNRGH
jgi:hypothetical protein